MSKTIFVRSSEHHTHSHRTDVHEHRAPTDQSVALLREMEIAAEEKRIATVRLEGNEINGTVQVFRSAPDCTLRFIAMIDVNGRRIVVDHVEQDHAKPADMISGLRDAIAKKLANEILDAALSGIIRQMGG